jgi:two-component system CheB/CheR fusion protein
MIVFAHHNIIRDAPFTRMDLISCRNLLIYLQPPAQKKVLSLFHFGLKTGGVLFLGPSENPSELADEFETIDLHWKIYRKRRDIRLPADLRVPLSAGSSHLHASALAAPAANPRTPDSLLHGAYDVLLGEYMPPALLINERRELLHAFGGAERFLSLKGGRASTNVVDLVDADLRIALSGALNRAEKEQCEAHLRGIRVSGCSPVKLGVRPIHNQHAGTTHMLITLEEEAATAADKSADDDAAEIDINQASRDRVAALESELRYTQENLQATVEELETSNEELQAANEELVASNEELQSTNEELHSVNEELYTVNAEYQRKINELTQLTNDMDNLLRSTEIGTIFLDRNLCIRKFTPQISRIFNLLPQDVGRRIDAFTHSIDEAHLLDEIQQVLRTATPFEREVHDRQGSWHFLRILPYRSSTAEVEGAVLTLIDISALKQAEAELQELHRQLTGILDNSETFICVKDLEGRYTLCNHASEHVLGAPPERVHGRTDYDFLPTDVADLLQAHDREVATSGRADRFEEVIPRPDGDHTYLSIKFPLRDLDSKIDRVGSVCTDISDRKQAEERQRLEVVRRDQFLAMLSHELRNPLGAIVNAIHAIDRQPNAASVARTRQVISRQAHHMSRLLDDLLDVSRVTQNKIELRKDVIDLRSTSEDAVDVVQPLIERRSQQLALELPDEPLFVEADPARLQQLQVNLLTNASKYSPEGGQIRLRAENGGSDALISVRDNGAGIPPEMRESIFDLFIQSDACIGRSDGGLGVGLTLVRSIVEKHGGRVEVQSDGPGTGSEFTVRLPLASKRPSPPRRRLRRVDNPSEIKILVVEDNPDARETLCTLLQLDGYQVADAAAGLSALEMIERTRPDVALIDIGLPELDGYEVARRIRADKAFEDVLLVALTGYGQDSDREAALAAGFDAHLVKPLSTEDLTRLLAERCSHLAD